MTGRSKQEQFDFIQKKDASYLPFNGSFSVPFVIPTEVEEEKSNVSAPKKHSNIKAFIKGIISALIMLIAFTFTLKSDLTVFEFILNKDTTVLVQGYIYEEFAVGVDSKKSQALIEERAYTKSKKIIRKAKAQAKEVSKTVSARPKETAFIWPTKGAYAVSSPYGYRDPDISGKSFHGGIDIVTGKGNSTGVPIIASASGTVIYVAKSYSGYGHQVLIDHGKGITTRYAHMKAGSISVSVGQKVKQGQQIGRIGSTGNSTGPHLHFEIIVNGVKQNPKKYLKN